MPIMMSKLYHALKSAGANEDAAISAAEEVAAYENKFTALELRLIRIEERMDGKFMLLSWMVGFNLALTVAILWKLFK